MRARDLALTLALVLPGVATPAAARLWKPTPEQLAQDSVTINHN